MSGNRGDTYSNDNNSVVIEGSPIATKIRDVAIEGPSYSNHKSRVAIEGIYIAMLLTRSNRVCCNT